MGIKTESDFNYRGNSNLHATAPAIGYKKVAQKPVFLAAAENPNPTSAGETPRKPKKVFKTWQQLQEEYAALNKLSTDEEKVIEYHKGNASANPKSYVIIKKGDCRAEVRSADGTLLDSFEIGIGKEKGDEIQLKNIEITEDPATKKIKIEHPKGHEGKTFFTTSAGIYTILGEARVGAKKEVPKPAEETDSDATEGSTTTAEAIEPQVKPQSGHNEFSMKAERGSTGVSISEIPADHPELARKIGNKTLKDNRFTNGDVNLKPEDFERMSKYVTPGTAVYILPEDANNKIVVKNGKLNLVQERFTGTVSTSKNTTSRPLKIDLKTEVVKTDDMEEFTKALSKKKVSLMARLGIDNDTYNNLANLALGITGQESKFGESWRYKLKEFCPPCVSLARWVRGKKSDPSRGLSQIKLGCFTINPKIKALLGKYGIEERGDLHDPANSAVATMVIITDMYKNEVPGVQRIRREQHKRNISAYDAISYMWHGRKNELLNPKEDVDPDNNVYVKNVRKSRDENFELKEVVTK